MREEDRREVPSGGRREYDPPAISLREHVETLLAGMQVRIELELAGLAEKVVEMKNASTHEHALVLDRLKKVEENVDALEKVEDRREGGKVVLGRGTATVYALFTLAVAIAGLIFGISNS